jgi:hypothetical protein
VTAGASLAATVAASRTGQGLTPTVTDPQVLRELGRLLANHSGDNAATHRRGSAQVRAAAAPAG